MSSVFWYHSAIILKEWGFQRGVRFLTWETLKIRGPEDISILISMYVLKFQTKSIRRRSLVHYPFPRDIEALLREDRHLKKAGGQPDLKGPYLASSASLDLSSMESAIAVWQGGNLSTRLPWGNESPAEKEMIVIRSVVIVTYSKCDEFQQKNSPGLNLQQISRLVSQIKLDFNWRLRRSRYQNLNN